MPVRKNITIRVPSEDPARRADVLVDGQRVTGVMRTSIEFGASDARPRVTLDLAVHEIDYFGDADVRISDRAYDTLIRFGWTPPGEFWPNQYDDLCAAATGLGLTGEQAAALAAAYFKMPKVVA